MIGAKKISNIALPGKKSLTVFSAYKDTMTAIIPNKKDNIIKTRGSGFSLSSLNQKYNQNKAGSIPPTREKNIEFALITIIFC